MKKNIVKDVKVDEVSLNRDFVTSHKTEADFLKTMSDKTYAHLFEGESREAKLKEVYQLAQPKKDSALAANSVGTPGKP